MTKVN